MKKEEEEEWTGMDIKCAKHVDGKIKMKKKEDILNICIL